MNTLPAIEHFLRFSQLDNSTTLQHKIQAFFANKQQQQELLLSPHNLMFISDGQLVDEISVNYQQAQLIRFNGHAISSIHPASYWEAKGDTAEKAKQGNTGGGSSGSSFSNNNNNNNNNNNG